jgi:hypothetical protein
MKVIAVISFVVCLACTIIMISWVIGELKNKLK